MSQELKERFSRLNESELETLINSYSVITVLIAGADGYIDASELEWGTKLTHIRSYNEDYGLNDLFSEVEVSFEKNVMKLMSEIPGSVENRYNYLKPKLEELNPLLAKLENPLAYDVYRSLKSFAKHIAKADGGFLGFATISSEENKMIKLPMINSIILENEEEE